MRGVGPFLMGFWAPNNLIRFEEKEKQLLRQQKLYVNSFLYISITKIWYQKKFWIRFRLDFGQFG